MLLTDEWAQDASRLTGIPWSYQRVHQRGVLHPVIDTSELEWQDKWRLAWAIIGAMAYCDLAGSK